MRIHNERQRKFNYEKLCDDMLHSLDNMKIMNYSSEQMLNHVRIIFNDKLINKTGDFEKYLSPKMTADQTLELVRKSIDYDRETSYFQKVKNAFTIVAYYFEGDALDQYKTDYKRLMQKDK